MKRGVRIIDTGKTAKRIVDIGPTAKRIDPDWVAKQLGATRIMNFGNLGFPGSALSMLKKYEDIRKNKKST